MNLKISYEIYQGLPPDTTQKIDLTPEVLFDFVKKGIMEVK